MRKKKAIGDKPPNYNYFNKSLKWGHLYSLYSQAIRVTFKCDGRFTVYTSMPSFYVHCSPAKAKKQPKCLNLQQMDGQMDKSLHRLMSPPTVSGNIKILTAPLIIEHDFTIITHSAVHSSGCLHQKHFFTTSQECIIIAWLPVMLQQSTTKEQMHWLYIKNVPNVGGVSIIILLC